MDTSYTPQSTSGTSTYDNESKQSREEDYKARELKAK
jgi:hypothetical protein